MRPPESAEDASRESLAAVRSRLAERGLLVTGPAILVPKEVRSDEPVLLDDVLEEPDGVRHPNAAPADEWDLSSQGARVVAVRCPQCQGTQPIPLDVTRFRCHSCERAWRWAVCLGCDELGFAVERQESWRCGCGRLSRSWWRTDTAARDAAIVVARRVDVAVRAEKAHVQAGMRRRRWKIVAGAVAGVSAVLAFVTVVRATEPTSATGNEEACRLFERFRADAATGTIPVSEQRERLAELAAASAGADPEVRDPALDLAAIGEPQRPAFLVAQTRLADGCEGLRPR